MSEPLTGEAWFELFSSFRRIARHLETRDHYQVSGEEYYLEQFSSGRYDDTEHRAYFADWIEPVRAATKAGKRFERVRVVPKELTPYLRLEVRWNRYNAEAGEDVRYLSRDKANELSLPAHDFWVFDSERLALMYFTADHRWLGADLITDPAIVAKHERWMDVAIQHAAPYVEYLAANPSREQP
jgi:hypothetical protein